MMLYYSDSQINLSTSASLYSSLNNNLIEQVLINKYQIPFEQFLFQLIR